MFKWIKGKVTKVVIGKKVATALATTDDAIKTWEAFVAMVNFSSSTGVVLLKETAKILNDHPEKLATILENFLPVIETLRVAIDLSKDEIMPIIEEIKAIDFEEITAQYNEHDVALGEAVNTLKASVIDTIK